LGREKCRFDPSLSITSYSPQIFSPDSREAGYKTPGMEGHPGVTRTTLIEKERGVTPTLLTMAGQSDRLQQRR
jgi:hypothetical protein